MSNVVELGGLQAEVLTNAQAERSLLGLLLTRPELIGSLPQTFDPGHYAWPANADIHRAIVEVGRPGCPAAIAVMQTLGMTDPEQRGYIASLLAAPASYMPGNAAQFADLVTDLYRRRSLLGLSEQMRSGAFTSTGIGGADAAIAQAMSGLEEIVNNVQSREICTLDRAMDLALAAAEEAARRQGPAGVSTGFRAIDDKLGGLEAGTLHVLAGRPGMGKSALGHKIAINAARAGYGVLEISLEMSAVELGRRALSIASGVPVWVMKQGRLSAHQAETLALVRSEFSDLPLTIEDGGGLTASLIALKARAAQRRFKKLGLIMVDHPRIVRP